MSDPVPELIRLLGQPVVFIAWPKGVKAVPMRWKHLRQSDMTTAYLAKLSVGNIGVALGDISGGLCAIDFDDETYVEFLSLNPSLENTFQTFGSRGRVFWIRITGSFPRSCKLKTVSGDEVGEFRANGHQSIVWGIHPDTKRPYEWLVKKPVIEIEFKALCWPESLSAKFKACIEDSEEREDDRSTRRPPRRSVSSGASFASVSSDSSIHSLEKSEIQSEEDVLKKCVPAKVHTNNRHLFVLARGVKSLEQLQGAPYTQKQRRDLFEKWHSRSVSFLRAGQSKEDYWLEFLNACAGAKYPLSRIRLAQAWQSAQEKELPPEAMQFENPELRLIVALCRELQLLNGKEPFFLASYTCQELLGHDSHTTAHKWLRALRMLGVIELIEQGTTHKASRYRYTALSPQPDGMQ